MTGDIVIKRVKRVEECVLCNKMLEELIKFESKFDNQINPNNMIEDHYERTLNKNDVVIFLAYNGDEAVGYIAAYKEKTNPALNNDVIKIMNLFVKDKHRKQNIGKILMNEVENWAKEKCDNFDIELDCISNNIEAIGFYKHLGYNPVKIKMRKSSN